MTCRVSVKRNEGRKELLHEENMFAPYRKIVFVSIYQKHVEERMVDHQDELFVRSRGTYFLIYNADCNETFGSYLNELKAGHFEVSD